MSCRRRGRWSITRPAVSQRRRVTHQIKRAGRHHKPAGAASVGSRRIHLGPKSDAYDRFANLLAPFDALMHARNLVERIHTLDLDLQGVDM